MNQISDHETQISELKNTLSNLRESKKSLESIVMSIASQWGFSSDPTPTPTPTVTKKETVQTVVSTSQEHDTEYKKKTRSKKTKPEPAPVSVSEPEPETEQVLENIVTKAMPSTAVEESKGDEPAPDGDEFVVTYKGIDYVVFAEDYAVIREDDKEENVVGTWDPIQKVISFH